MSTKQLITEMETCTLNPELSLNENAYALHMPEIVGACIVQSGLSAIGDGVIYSA